MKSKTILIAAIVLWGFLAGCGDNECEKAVFETTLTIQNEFGEESEMFSAGDPIRFIVRIENLSDESRVLEFSSARMYDIAVTDSTNSLVWNWAYDKFFTPVVTELEFEPNEIVIFSEDWSQTLNDGERALPGAYQAAANVAERETEEFIAGPAPIEIVP